MNIKTYLEQLLITNNGYNKIGCEFIKEEYWVIDYNDSTIKGYIILAVDNLHKSFEIDNWQQLEHTTLIDIFLKNKFITKTS